MTPEYLDANSAIAIEWVFDGMTVVGIYILLVLSGLLIRKVSKR